MDQYLGTQHRSSQASETSYLTCYCAEGFQIPICLGLRSLSAPMCSSLRDTSDIPQRRAACRTCSQRWHIPVRLGLGILRLRANRTVSTNLARGLAIVAHRIAAAMPRRRAACRACAPSAPCRSPGGPPPRAWCCRSPPPRTWPPAATCITQL